jgi:transcriptional regulator with XRE-family HTH domain
LPGSEAEEIGRRVKALADDLSLTVEQMASSLSVSQDTVYKLFRGETVEQWLRLSRVARLLKTRPDSILGFAGSGTEAEALAQGHVEARLAAAQAELRLLRDRVADLQSERDAWRAQAARLAGKLPP